MVGTPPQNKPQLTEEQAQEMLQALRRKQGNWVEWADHCQALQGSGYNPQQIFEKTGFEPIQQNQIMGASQVYASMLKVGVPEPVAQHFQQRASDVLYEFRVLSPQDRATAASFAFDRKFDSDEAKELGKSMKDFTRLPKVPDGFSSLPGDVLAYYAWFAARQKSDLQQRSIFIAKGLKSAQSPEARQQIEKLLTDFSVAVAKKAPRYPIYRLEADEEMPRMMPVVGTFPLSVAAVGNVDKIEPQEPYGMIQVGTVATWVPVPGWQVIRKAKDPVVVLWPIDQLPLPLPGAVENALVIIDRGDRAWTDDAFFVTGEGDLEMVWFETEPEESVILGRVILMIRPKKVLDEGHTEQLWQFDE
jgi:Rubisco Assembly chaperone C-terminal domain/Rubisco accumulation factor 1 alpha helical domain/Rubisco accumulation factor 1 helix turn helix domain